MCDFELEGRGERGEKCVGFEERRAVGLIVWCCGMIIHGLLMGVFGWMMGWDRGMVVCMIGE